MLDDLYNARILALAADVPRLGRLEAPDGTATAHSKLCGSTVTVDVKVQDGVVADFAHDVKACALGQASSSIMARHVLGATPDELKELRGRMVAFLKDGAPVEFSGRWEDLKVLEPVRAFKSRHASTLLTFDATVQAVEAALARSDARETA